MGKPLRSSLTGRLKPAWMAAIWLLGAATVIPALARAADPTAPVLVSLNCGTELNRDCGQAAARITALFDARIRQQVLGDAGENGYSRRKDLLQKLKAGVSGEGLELESSHEPFFKACSLNGNRFNGNEKEIEKNHLGESCGEFDTIECRKSSKGEIRAQLMAGSGTRESAWVRGGFIEALDCVSNEIAAEVRTNRSIRVPGTEDTNACLKLVPLYEANRQKLTELAARVDPEKKGRCRFTDAGLPEQAGCYAEGSLEVLDALFAALLVCESFRRADEGYLGLANVTLDDAARRRTWKDHSQQCSSKAGCEAFSSCTREKFRELVGAEARARFHPGEGGKCRLLDP